MFRSPHERRRPTVAAFVGYPGMGKSTQATAIATAIGARRLRLGRFLKDRGLMKTREEMEDPFLWYQRLLEHTELFLDHAVLAQITHLGAAVLDGFPRAHREIEFLKERADRHDWTLVLLNFDLPTPLERSEFSLARQRSRAVSLGRKLSDTWYWQKIRLAEQYEMTALERARELGVRIITIDPRRSPMLVMQAVRQALRLDFEHLPWNWRVLEIVRNLAPPAFIVGGHFYRPFWNGLFGPMQEPWNVGVALDSDEHVVQVGLALERALPEYRWRVGNVVRFVNERLGVEVDFAEDALRLSHNIIGISGGVRLLLNGNLHIVFGADAEAHLRRGVLQPSANAKLDEAAQKARLLVQDYPGLSAPFIDHERLEVIPDWATIHEKTLAMEHGGRRMWSGLSDQEQVIAKELVIFADVAEKKPSAPPLAPRSLTPTEFPWDAPDGEFREWLLQEFRQPIPSEIRDPLLEAALRLQHRVPQKPTHQGWATHQHAASVLLQLETDRLLEFRRPLRVAALLHDIGKKWNIETPGAHSAIGATQWEGLAPAWLAAADRGIVTFLIRNHDLLGRLARGVKEPDYTGALDPAYARTVLSESGLPPKLALELIFELNRADVGSVAALRWTIPELEMSRDMICAGLS